MGVEMNQLFAEGEDEMKKGSDGYICRLEVIRSGKHVGGPEARQRQHVALALR